MPFTGSGAGVVVVVVVVVSVSICPLVISTTTDITHKHASLSAVQLTNRNANKICTAPISQIRRHFLVAVTRDEKILAYIGAPGTAARRINSTICERAALSEMSHLLSIYQSNYIVSQKKTRKL